MGDVEVGGNGSVIYKANLVRGRKALGDGNFNPGQGPRGHHREGVDETVDPHDFTISIRIPKDSARANAKYDFGTALQAAAAAVFSEPVNTGAQISFTLPIEDNNHGGPNEDQIQIVWNSPPVSLQAPRGGLQAARGGRKKRPTAKKRPPTAKRNPPSVKKKKSSRR